ncbi:MAG: hypothetical protein Q8O16_01385, partial [Dehalococcoidia bacterium]|nr:hypothetical protein [Dehalococcoidia bacterium]
DSDSLIISKLLQSFITSDDEICLSFNGTGDYFVIARVRSYVFKNQPSSDTICLVAKSKNKGLYIRFGEIIFLLNTR